MKKSSKYNDMPVSKVQLAEYIGVHATMMSMIENTSRTLPRKASLKLTTLIIDIENSKQSRQRGKSFLKAKQHDADLCAKMAKKMNLDIPYFMLKARKLNHQLDETIKLYNRDMQWLNVIDNRIASLSKNDEDAKGDELWLAKQQAKAAKRLQENGIASQVKLQLQIETLKANAALYKSALRKMKKQLA